MLVELQLGQVSGFDLSPLNTYRWYPHHERTRLDRCGGHFVTLACLVGRGGRSGGAASAATAALPSAPHSILQQSALHCGM